MKVAPRLQIGHRRFRLPVLVLAVSLAVASIFGLAPYAGTAGATDTDNASSRVTDMTEIQIEASDGNLAQLQSLGITTSQSKRAGYLQADIATSQLQTLDALGLPYEKGLSFLLVEGGARLEGEASVTGNNGTNMNIHAFDSFYSNVNIQGAPSGKTVIRTDVAIVANYPDMCYLYLTVFHPSMVMTFNAWAGANSGPCTANINKSWTTHAFDFADINGVWKLQVQETQGVTAGFLDYWSMRIYYQSDATNTPTPTRTPTPTGIVAATATPTVTPTRTVTPTPKSRLSLPIILDGY